MKRNVMLSMFFTLCFSFITLSACSSSEGNSTDSNNNGMEDNDGTYYVTIGGAGSGGRWYQSASAVASTLNENLPDNLDVKASGVTSPGVSLGNIERLTTNDIEMGLVYGFDGYFAYHGEGWFEEEKDLLGWFQIDSQFVRAYVDPGIESWGDFQGKKVAIGAPGTSDNMMAKQILELHGVDINSIDFQEVGRESSVDALINKQVDAWVTVVGRDSGHAQRLVSDRGEVKQLAITKEVEEEIIEKYPYMEIDKIGDTLTDQEEVNSVRLPSFIAVSSDMDEDFLYEATKAIFENLDDVYKKVPYWTDQLDNLDVTLERGSELPIPLHPGAKKFFEEKGIEVEENTD